MPPHEGIGGTCMMRSFRSGRAGRRVIPRSLTVYLLTAILIILGSSPGLARTGSGDAPPKGPSGASRGKSRKAPRKSTKERACAVCEQVEALNREVRELRQQLEAN